VIAERLKGRTPSKAAQTARNNSPSLNLVIIELFIVNGTGCDCVCKRRHKIHILLLGESLVRCFCLDVVGDLSLIPALYQRQNHARILYLFCRLRMQRP
jgi:hypothetical protein